MTKLPVRPAVRVVQKLVELLDRRDPDWSVAQRRAKANKAEALALHLLSRRTRQPITISEHLVPVADGSITVRVYTPQADGPAPAHLYIHGGAFWLGELASYDHLCRWYAAEAGCVVISVGYRLAPEHKYPSQPEDCYAALCWVAERAGDLGVNPTRISVGGVSAGGGLAAAVALMARDRGGPPICFQLLEIPALDCTLSQPSIHEFATGYLLTRADMEEAKAFYLQDPDQATDSYASPLLTKDLAGLPPAFILTAECDPLRDDGESYGARLDKADVPAAVLRCEGHIHGSMYLTRLLPSARRYVDEACAALAAAHEVSDPTPLRDH